MVFVRAHNYDKPPQASMHAWIQSQSISIMPIRKCARKTIKTRSTTSILTSNQTDTRHPNPKKITKMIGINKAHGLIDPNHLRHSAWKKIETGPEPHSKGKHELYLCSSNALYPPLSNPCLTLTTSAAGNKWPPIGSSTSTSFRHRGACPSWRATRNVSRAQTLPSPPRSSSPNTLGSVWRQSSSSPPHPVDIQVSHQCLCRLNDQLLLAADCVQI